MKAMIIMVYFILIELLYFAEVTCESRQLNSVEYIRSIMNDISRVKENYNSNVRKSGNVPSLRIDERDFKKWLRNEALEEIEKPTEPDRQDELEVLVENELLNALSKKTSALLDRPYVQKKGRNDFLVIRPDLTDPFVTIVPNDIYYNSEKKCVNWMDDCNQKGLRERLLQKVNSPYK